METGLKFYHSKPYLLVERNPQKEIKIKSSIIYLPDLENPTYAKIKPGLGSADLKIDLENGILKSYGLVTDTKIPETLTSVAGALASTGIIPGVETGEGEEEEEEETEQQSGDDNKVKLLEKIKPVVNLAIEDLNSLDIKIASKKKIRESVVQELKKIVELIDEVNPEKIEEIAKGLRNNAKELLKILRKDNTDNAKEFNSNVNEIINKLISAADTIEEVKPKSPEWELYEITMDKGKTLLVKVEKGGL